MFHMSLKYTHVSTSLGHLKVTFFFQGISHTAHIVTRTLTGNTKLTQLTNNQEAAHPMVHRTAAIQKIGRGDSI
jgi:hypothetical protein